MALFNFDFAKRRAEREAAEKAAKARAGFASAIEAGQRLPTAPSPFLGVSPDLTDNDLEALVRNEEARKLAAEARLGQERTLFDASAAMLEAGMDPVKLLEARGLERRSSTTNELWNQGRLTDEQYLDAIGGKEVSPYKFGAGYSGNRYTGEQRLNPAGEALAGQRVAAGMKNLSEAEAADALAAYRGTQNKDLLMRFGVVADQLANPEVPDLMKVDIAQNKPVWNPTDATVIHRDGTKTKHKVVPNVDGTYRSAPVTDPSGMPLTSSGDAKEIQLSKEAQYLMRVKDISEREAVEMLLHNRTMSPLDFWRKTYADKRSSTVGTPTPEDEKKALDAAVKDWRLLRPGDPVPVDLDALYREATGEAVPALETETETADEEATTERPRFGRSAGRRAPSAKAGDRKNDAPNATGEASPPVPGARQAPDGNWYLRGHDGRWLLVEP